MIPDFDPKFKIVIKLPFPENYAEILDWINNNSEGSVEVQLRKEDGSKVDPFIPWYTPAGLIRSQMMFVAFENEDDATFFKIKYSV